MNLEAIRGEMKPVTGEGSDYDALLDGIGEATVRRATRTDPVVAWA